MVPALPIVNKMNKNQLYNDYGNMPQHISTAGSLNMDNEHQKSSLPILSVNNVAPTTLRENSSSPQKTREQFEE